MSIPRWVGLCILFLMAYNSLAEPQKTAPVTFEVALPGLEGPVTLGIFSGDGALVRLLCREASVDTIPLGLNGALLTWDGCDDSGTPVRPGTYRARGFVHGPLNCRPQPWEAAAPGERAGESPAPGRSLGMLAAEDPLYSPRPTLLLTARVEGRYIVLEANGLPLLALPPEQEQVIDATLLPRSQPGLVNLRISTPGGSRVVLLSGLDKLAPIEAGTLEIPAAVPVSLSPEDPRP
jgi:hypothetical protein